MIINDTFSKLGDEIGSIAISIKDVDENTKLLIIRHKAVIFNCLILLNQ
jgi:hypothetical protein